MGLNPHNRVAVEFIEVISDPNLGTAQKEKDQIAQLNYRFYFVDDSTIRAPLLMVTFVWIQARAGASSLPYSPGQPTNLVVKVFSVHGAPVPDAVVFVYATTEGLSHRPINPTRWIRSTKSSCPMCCRSWWAAEFAFLTKMTSTMTCIPFRRRNRSKFLLQREPAKPILFDRPGVVQLGCNIHDWMSGIILVLPNPFFGKTGVNGKAILSGLPPTRMCSWRSSMNA